MAKPSYGDPTDPQGRAPSLYGVLVVDTVRGKIRMRQWPAKRPGKRPAVNEYWTDWLRQCMRLYKYAQPSEVQLWRAAVHGLPVKITDVYTAVMRGTMWALVGPTGTIYYPRQAIDKMSYSLDAIAQVPGSLLIRGEDTWQGVPVVPSSGLILMTTDTPVPNWLSLTEAGVGRASIGADGVASTDTALPNGAQVPINWYDVNQDAADPPIWSVEERSRFYAPMDGTYSVTAWVQMTWPRDITYYTSIRVNGSLIAYYDVLYLPDNHSAHQSIAGNVRLSAGDYVTVVVQQTSGTDASTVDGHCNVTLLG